MNDQDKAVIRSQTDNSMFQDIASFIEDIIVHRHLTQSEEDNLKIKCQYWFLVARQKERFVIQEVIDQMRKQRVFDQQH